MKLTVTLNTRTSEYHDIEVDAGPNNSIPMILRSAADYAGIAVSAITSYVIVGVAAS